MSQGPDPRAANAQVIEQERRRLSQRLDEVARLCESGMPGPMFYGELLNRLIESLAALAGCVWLRTPQGNLQQQFQINMQQIALDSNENDRAQHDALLRAAFAGAQSLHLPPKSTMGPAEEGRPAPGNPTTHLLLLVPIKANEQVVGLIEVFQGANRPTAAIQGFLQYMTMMADLASRYQRNQLVGQLVGQQTLWTQLEAFARTIHGTLSPTEVAFHVANEGRRLVECDRISVAVRRGGQRAAIEAVSGSDVVEKRSNQVRLMRKLCEEVLHWGERLVFTGVKDDSLPPKVLQALDDYLHESPSKLLVVMPLHDERDGDGKDKPRKTARSVLLMESFETPADPQQTIARLEVVSRHATSALYNALEHRRIPFRWVWMPLAKLQEGLGGKTRSIVMLVIAGLSIAGAALYILPYPLKIEAAGQALPEVRRTVFTPVPGTVERFDVRADQEVGEDDDLAQMYDSGLATRVRDLLRDIKQATAKAALARTLADLKTDLAEKANYKGQAALEASYADAETRKLNELYSRTNSRRDAVGFFPLRAPKMTSEEKQLVDVPRWKILTSDFGERLGKEFKPGEPIMRLGAKSGPWEIELKIPQKHIGQVFKGFERTKSNVLDVDFLLASDKTRLYKGKLYRSRIGGEANPSQEASGEQESVVLAYISIEDPEIPEGYRVPRGALVSGTDVTAKIRCGSAAAGYSLFYGVWEFLYEKVVFYLF